MNPRLPLMLLVALAAACGPAGPQPPAAVNHVRASPSPPAAEPTTAPPATPTAAPPTSAPAAPDRCHTAGLQVTFAGSQGAAGTIFDTFHVANAATSPCTLYGFVGALMLDAAGHPLPTRVVRNGGMFSNQAGPSQFLLQPGAAATFQAAWSDVPHGSESSCPQAAKLEVTPPDEFDHVVITVSGWSLAPCGAGEIDVTPLRAAGAGP